MIAESIVLFSFMDQPYFMLYITSVLLNKSPTFIRTIREISKMFMLPTGSLEFQISPFCHLLTMAIVQLASKVCNIRLSRSIRWIRLQWCQKGLPNAQNGR